MNDGYTAPVRRYPGRGEGRRRARQRVVRREVAPQRRLLQPVGAARLVEPRVARLGFGRMVTSEIEAPNTSL
jgi:hypothetical protein